MRFFYLMMFLPVVAAAQSYPPGIFEDTAYAPFVYGVASGDPTAQSVIIWTKVRPSEDTILVWQVSTDSLFTKIVREGSILATSISDYCVQHDVQGLQTNTTYYYRFATEKKKFSVVGIAKTLPIGDVKHIKLAAVSCSSIWAGHFNAYSRIAERGDVDFVIHLGDYVYDYPDRKQLNRMPSEYPKDCASLTDWRERHTYYLLDADLRKLRQQKTWITIWDNHDTDVEEPGKTEEAIQAFYEYLPIRMPDIAHPENIYRKFSIGNLADLIMIDMLLFRGKEEYAPGKKSVLGLKQDEWLKTELQNSTATWRLIGNQEMMTDWLSSPTIKKLTGQGDGRVMDPGNWSGYPEDRQRLYDLIEMKKINNVVVLTGDVHMSFVMDMTGTPRNRERYNRKTGEGAIGVEITTPSISRVNMRDAGIPGGFIPAVQDISNRLNPHHVWTHFTEHGYLTLDVTPERCIAEFWYVPINKVTSEQKFKRGYVVKTGVNHWERDYNTKPLPVNSKN